ncbi:MAG: CHAD domain-containing protein [Rhodospirillales bacterium]|nr:CHAD domain-containing protein [Rhodospirillales bacterium]
MFRACADHCAANHDAVLDGNDPEGVHQFRVALRRLRSVLSAFQSVLSTVDLEWLDREAKLLIDLLGPARDWDVFIAETLAAVREARPDDKTLACLAAAAGTQRGRAYERAQTLRDPEFTTFLLRFGRWIETAAWRETADHAVLDQPLAGLAGRLLDQRHERVLKRGRGFENLSDSRLHRLRIVLKKLRYPCEFFAGQFPESKSNPYVRALRGLQSDLGRLNDAAVAEQRLTALLRDHRKNGDLGAISVAAGLVIGWHARACEASRVRLAEDWHVFAAAKPFWRAPDGSAE